MAAVTAPNDRAAQAHFNDAVARHLAGDAKGAIALYKKALAADPGFAEACNNLATLFASRGDEGEAEQLLERAVALKPDYGEAHNNIGLMRATRGDHARAVPAFERAIALDGTKPAWLNNLGNSYVEMFRFADALETYDAALRIDPTNAECWSNRGLALRGLRRPEEASASFRRAIALVPAHVNAISNLAVVLKEQKQLDEAVTTMARATELDPANVAVWVNFAAIHEARGEYDRMRELAQRALEIDPNYPEAYNLLANAEMEAGRYDEALALYERSLALDPDNRNANWNLALIWLLHGDFERGWKQFEWRKRLQSVVFDHGTYPGAQWEGESLAGRDILLHSEQGIGDAIQFIRYARLLKAQGARRVYLECPYPIVPLLSGVAGVDGVIARGVTLPSYDVHANLMSLPALLGTTLASVPARVPYIPVEPRAARDLVAVEPGELAVGFVWAGNPVHARDFLRSAPLDAFRALAATPGARFFSLQKGEAAERELAAHPIDGVVNLAPHLNDFRDTAAVIDALDLVITVDTSVAHLAGALGKETWLLLPHVPDFRWMLERDDSPWYPTMRLYRQSVPRDWESVFAHVERALRERVAAVPIAEPTRPASDAEALSAAVDAVVTLPSATRVADGRARFDLWLPLALLADSARFAEYEAELVGGGHDLPVRAFLDDWLSSEDVVLDVRPGLGLTALSAVTAPTPPALLVVADADTANVTRVTQLANRRAPVVRTECAPDVVGALAVACASGGGRVAVRLGSSRDAEPLADAIGRQPQGQRPQVILWSSAVPNELQPIFAFLASLDYVTVTLSLHEGEPSLDAIEEMARAQSLVSLLPETLAELERRVATAGERGPDHAAHSSGSEASRYEVVTDRVTQLGIDWELRADTGWGVYGTNLALELERHGAPRPAIFAADTSSHAPLVRFRLDRALREGSERVAALNRTPDPVAFDGVMLRAMGNNFAHGALWDRVRATRNIGLVFFEDTAFDAEALARAAALDLVVCGSHWNEQLLRARGLTNVATVLQGIDPTVFHPAPRSGHLAERFVIFSGGKLEYRKGQDIVARAFRIFQQRHPDALLLTAWHNNWPQLIADMDLAGHMSGAPPVVNGRVDVAGWLARNGIPAGAVLDVGHTPNALMGQVVREADVALFANRAEGGTNLVAMECMAAGVPTIVSDNTGHRDLVATRGCLPLTRQHAVRKPTRFYREVEGWGESDVEEMVAALEQVYTDRAAVQAMATRGAAAMAGMSWQRQVEEFLATIRPLLA
ncbi:MAG: tetratricopeptide repeat protein [Gemmatimonadaceae bacterium]|nr:tetratricopeptide repeat protein [Gemmatimonadaceae bacterium]